MKQPSLSVQIISLLVGTCYLYALGLRACKHLYSTRIAGLVVAFDVTGYV